MRNHALLLQSSRAATSYRFGRILRDAIHLVERELIDALRARIAERSDGVVVEGGEAGE